MNIALSVEHLEKSFDQVEIFRDFNFRINRGEITAIIGPNGSGKSTLLNILAGVTDIDSGKINSGISQHAYIFQDYRQSLLPWRTTFENAALPLEIKGVDRREIHQRVRALGKVFGFEFCPREYPYHLSGGQQQILAFIRALVTEPTLLFMDEPFSALDYENSLRLRESLQTYFLASTPTILLVTHDVEEAVQLGRKIVVFSRKPTSILSVINNDLPYPRKLETFKTEEFAVIQNRVLAAFQRSAQL